MIYCTEKCFETSAFAGNTHNQYLNVEFNNISHYANWHRDIFRWAFKTPGTEINNYPECQI